MTPQEILFIINPVSEEKKKVNTRALIDKYIDKDKIKIVIEYSKYAGHAYELAKEATNRFKKIVAVGGDGTVNQVSRALVGSGSAMGIIPLGSGNGLARALNIPVKPAKAMARIIQAGKVTIDSGIINGHHFINMAGIGFDAEVAHTFGLEGKRGLKAYVKEVLHHLKTYKPSTFSFEEGSSQLEISPFLLSIANSSQYGNNAHISPLASFDDGLLDVCVLKKFPLWKSPAIGARLFFQTMHKSHYMDIFQVTKCVVKNSEKVKGHIDGEPVFFEGDIIIESNPGSITILA